jgi:hypothetical protein
MTVFAGTVGTLGYSNDGTQATKLNAPQSILILNGKMYLGTQMGLFQIDMNTKIIKALQYTNSRPVSGLAYQNGKIYACVMSNHYMFSVDLTNNFAVTSPVSGSDDVQGNIDGTLLQARYNRYAISCITKNHRLTGMTTNTNDGYIYIADTDNRVVKRLSVTGNSVTTWAGDNTNGDGRLASKARLSRPYAIAFNTLTGDTFYVSGNIFIPF